ncbi:MAG: carboxypeptidase regulatory-like domain-containing protein, partial [Thermoplasmata archaeon]|nr:carboxypeptidase regulatory-like domain-containing protein [Thermoplasmata archaeon]
MRANVTIENLGDLAANGTGYVSLKVLVPTTGDVIFNPFNRKLNFTGVNELGPGENVTVIFSNWTTATKGSYLLEVEIIYMDGNSTNNKVTFTIYVKSTQWPGPIEFTWSVDPPRGHSDDLFTYEATYGFNTLPDLLLVEIDLVNHSMIESDPFDIFPDDGKDYYFSTYLDLGDHSFRFWVEVGTRELNTTVITGPWVNITLRNPSVMPVEGYITTDFVFKVNYGSVDNDPPDEIFAQIDELRFNMTRNTPTTSYISANVEFRGTARGDQILRSPMVVYFVCSTGADEYRIGPMIEGGPRMERTNLTGVVRDQEHTPLEGVLVELTPGVSTTTDGSGAYRLMTYFGMEFELRYSLEGYENVYFSDIDLIGSQDHVINPIMTLIPGGALLEGYVTDEEGLLLEDVILSLDNLGTQYWFTTNSTGHYLYEDLPRIGGYKLSVESHIYEDHSISIDLTSEGYMMVNITLEERAMSIYLDPHSGIVPVHQSFTLTFPRSINRSSLAFRISNGTEVLFSTLEYHQNDTMVTLTPMEDLLYDIEYRITLDMGVEDVDGIILSWRPLGWTVTTRKQAFSGLDT